MTPIPLEPESDPPPLVMDQVKEPGASLLPVRFWVPINGICFEEKTMEGGGQLSQEVHCAQEGEERSSEPRRIIPKETCCRMSLFPTLLKESMVLLPTLLRFFVFTPGKMERCGAQPRNSENPSGLT
jgi:hypothetical protein